MQSRVGQRTLRLSRGVVAVEFAVLFPLIMAIFFSIMEWGFVVYNKAVLTNAAREGARAGIVLRTAADRAAGLDFQAAQNTVAQYCSANSPLISMLGSKSCTATTQAVGGKASGVGALQVTVSHTYEPTGLLTLYSIMKGPITHHQSTVMTYE